MKPKTNAEQRLADVLATVDAAVKRAKADRPKRPFTWHPDSLAAGELRALSRLQRNLKRKAKP